MRVESAWDGSNEMNYQSKTAEVSAKLPLFPLEFQEETSEAAPGQPGEVPPMFAGMSFDDLMNNSEIKKYPIPVVNQIVTSKNPEDGNYYVTSFTDHKITCEDALGKRVWELDINDANRDKVKDYFSQFTPYSWAKELYSGDNMGMATVKDFWIELFKK